MFSLGMAGSVSKNPRAKVLLRKHNRIVKLAHQSRAVGEALIKAQEDAHIPAKKLLSLVRTMPTRWGNQFEQLTKNCTLRPVIDPIVESYKRNNRGKLDAVVEHDESESNTANRIGNVVSAAELGLTADDWDNSIELEAVLQQPYVIKESLDTKGFITGAQSLLLMHDLMECNSDDDRALQVLCLPASASLADRSRTVDMRSGESLSIGMTTVARSVLASELRDRFFAERPSNGRLVQMYMGKTMPSSVYLPEAWQAVAKSLYLQMLRRAVPITRSASNLRNPSPRKVARTSTNSTLLLRHHTTMPELDAQSMQSDVVTEEIERWKCMDQDTINACIDKGTGMLNEFVLMYTVRSKFPLHYTVFKQVSGHLPHEANTEQLFSLAGRLSDPNKDPIHLARQTRVAKNKDAFMPSVKAIWTHYKTKFSKNGKLDEEETLGM